MSEERLEVSDHWMILQCGGGIWNRWREMNSNRPDLRFANLENANLENADLRRADLRRADLRNANLWNANLRNANLWNASLENAALGSADLGSSNLRLANLRNANLENADLYSAKLGRADLYSANLENANLENANLRGARLGRANLKYTNLGNANLWNASLENVDLGSASLENVDLGFANLRGANLGSASLENADLGSANLSGANLGSANLKNADLESADLGSADLGGANLRGADFEGTNLRGASLKKARLSSTHFHNVDLRETRALTRFGHSGPSSVSSQTFKRSQGQIPEGFLRGCGLTDWEIFAVTLHDPNLRPDEVTDIAYQIDQARGASPIVPLSLFISYSHENQRFVQKLEARFDQDGIRYWRDVHDLKAGPIEAQVDRAIGLQRATLLVLSEDSVESDWVLSEARRAREVEKVRRKGGGGKYVLCPIALDDAWKTCDWPRRLREQIMEYNILDFARWGSDEEFEKTYEKLKTGLGIYYANEAPGAGGNT